MDYFVEHNENPQSRRVGDCVVRAISTALGQQWDKTFLDLCVQGIMYCDMPSSNAIWGSYLKDMMMRKFDEMLGEAKTPAEREAIKKCIENIQDY